MELRVVVLEQGSARTLDVPPLTYPPQFSSIITADDRDLYVAAIEHDGVTGWVYVVPERTQTRQ